MCMYILTIEKTYFAQLQVCGGKYEIPDHFHRTDMHLFWTHMPNFLQTVSHQSQYTRAVRTYQPIGSANCSIAQ
jgi:hypothetical protein